MTFYVHYSAECHFVEYSSVKVNTAQFTSVEGHYADVIMLSVILLFDILLSPILKNIVLLDVILLIFPMQNAISRVAFYILTFC